MKKYKRPYIAGPSGSTMLLYNLLFNVIGLRKDSHTPAKMLGFIIGDYIPHFHTLTEILLSFSIISLRGLSFKPISAPEENV